VDTERKAYTVAMMEKQDKPEKRARRARRSYTNEFKAGAVRLSRG
jgi:transposase-like protein